MKTFALCTAMALALTTAAPAIAVQSPDYGVRGPAGHGSYMLAQSTTGAASTNTTTGSTATSDTDPSKGSTAPDANKDTKPPQQK